jgi:hypothetical protein
VAGSRAAPYIRYSRAAAAAEDANTPSRPGSTSNRSFDTLQGASLTMIDRHYGHLAREGREHAIRLLDELSAGERPRWTLVDAAWTSKPAAGATVDNGNSKRSGPLSGQLSAGVGSPRMSAVRTSLR